jgi:protein-disulfide isomerase
MSQMTLNKQIIALLVVVAVIAVAATFLSRDEAPQLVQDGAATREAALASEHSPTFGNADAKVHIVEFLDPACETCALFFPMVKRWMAEVPGEIRLSVRHVAFHSGSDYAVRILEASRKQDKYWETLEALLASQRQWTQHHTVLPEKIGPAIAGAIFLKVSKTPDYYVNGRPLPSFGRQQLAQLIGEELEK